MRAFKVVVVIAGLFFLVLGIYCYTNDYFVMGSYATKYSGMNNGTISGGGLIFLAAVMGYFYYSAVKKERDDKIKNKNKK